MKKFSLFVFCLLSASFATAPSGRAPNPSPSSLAALMPAGPLLFIESPDLAMLVHDWENSKEKQKWLASDNYRVFSRSRLFLRLQEAQRQFAVRFQSACLRPPEVRRMGRQRGGLMAYSIQNSHENRKH